MAQRIRIPFQGTDSGIEELTWGQRANWRPAVMSGTTESAGGMMQLEPGMTVDDIVRIFKYLMSRHQALRTKVFLDADGEPKQSAEASGELELEVVDADDEGDPAVIAEALRIVYENAKWDFANEWPVRVAVVRQKGMASHMVAMYSNLVVDGYGIDALVNDLSNMDPRTGEPVEALPGATPLEQAAAQRSPSGRRQSQQSLKRWEKQLRSIEPLRYHELPPELHSSPRYWECKLRSPAMNLALHALTERTGVHSGAIMMGANAVAMAHMSGNPQSVMRMYVSNRFRPGFSTSVSNLAQSALVVVDVADCTFDEVISRAFKSQLSAGLHGYYEPRDLWELIDRVSTERECEFDLMAYYNDRRRGLAATPQGPAPTQEQVLAALPETEFSWSKRWDSFDCTSYMTLNNVPGTLECIMHVDTHCVRPQDLERVCLGLESLIVSAAFDAQTPSGVNSSLSVTVP